MEVWAKWEVDAIVEAIDLVFSSAHEIIYIVCTCTHIDFVLPENVKPF